ncbi:GNAT family N-acetyltransferase [Herbaspirillum sp. GCM10030257]|uniref:GNAT family N-acetyltransferase n=1 Tax=Herbaspirillum sp. GCM10030257 TaxID=3273393 RepID=UPI00361CA766
MTMSLFDNIVWHTLVGPHYPYTIGGHSVRRYARGFPPIAAFRDTRDPDWHALGRLVDPGERVYCDGFASSAPEGWCISSESLLNKMIWQGSVDMEHDPAPEAVRLDSRSAAAAVELAGLTNPGPFTGRALELGEYFGIFDGMRLVAMAGSRGCAGGFSEITGVCTHPDFTGRGLARRLVIKILQHQLLQGQRPFLRVMSHSAAARRLYLRVGFYDYAQSAARTLLRY